MRFITIVAFEQKAVSIGSFFKSYFEDPSIKVRACKRILFGTNQSILFIGKNKSNANEAYIMYLYTEYRTMYHILVLYCSNVP